MLREYAIELKRSGHAFSADVIDSLKVDKVARSAGKACCMENVNLCLYRLQGFMGLWLDPTPINPIRLKQTIPD